MKRLTVLILMLFGFQAWSQQVEPLIFREKIYDFGEIEEGKGNADHEFTFTNNSGRPVKILSVQASCGCTTPGWSQSPVPHGRTGFIKASFDPKGRPGYFNKSLTITSDFDTNPIVIQIKGQVKVPSSVNEAEEFSFSNGNLYFKTKSFNFGTVYINQSAVQKEFEFKNEGTGPIKISDIGKPPYLKVDMPFVIGPQAKGIIKVSYDGRERGQFGFASDNIQFTTDDAGHEVKSISVFAMLEEYYAIPGPEEVLKGPILFLREQHVDLGRFHAGAVIQRTVAVRNTGKKDLQIKALKGNCACISAEIDQKIVRPGDSTMLRISFKPQNRGGTQQKAITLYSNDPRNTVQRINVLAFVED